MKQCMELRATGNSPARLAWVQRNLLSLRNLAIMGARSMTSHNLINGNEASKSTISIFLTGLRFSWSPEAKRVISYDLLKVAVGVQHIIHGG